MVIPLIAGLAAFVAYLVTLAPGLPGGDSGELIAVAATGGVAHPPGYPLYTLLARAWIALLPFSSVAWRVNLLSALCAAAAVAVVASVVLRLTRSAGAALVSAWLVAFAPPLWKNAIVAEVFALHALLAALVLDAFSRVLEGADEHAPRAAGALPVLGLAFLSGTLVAHHHTLVLLALPADLVVFTMLLAPLATLRRVATRFRRPCEPSAALAGACVLAFALGLAPLATLPIAAARHPVISWGDLQGARDLLRLLLRVDYGTFQLDPLGATRVADHNHLLMYASSLARDIGLLGIAFTLLGLIALRRRPLLAVALGGFAVLQAVFLLSIHLPTHPLVLRGVVERFYILPDLVLAIGAGLGVAAELERVPHRWRTAAGAALAIAAVVVPIVQHGARLSQRGNRLVEHLAGDVLASVPRDGVLFTQGDVIHNALLCLQQVEHQRPDVTVVDQELLADDWYVRALRRREPDLLPPLGGGERLTLRDGSVIEGRVLAERGDTLVVRQLESTSWIVRADVARIEQPPPGDLFVAARARDRTSWLLPSAIDRYSGLPGTVNLLWIDHLKSRRPVAFIGLKDDSWTLEYRMVASGYVLLATPRNDTPRFDLRAAQALVQLATFQLDDLFGRYDPWSFEAAERARVADFVARAAALLAQQSRMGPIPEHPGMERLKAIVLRAEREPTPEPALLKAAAMVRMFDPGLRDDAMARADLRRWLESGASGPEADEARRWVEGGSR